MGAADSEPANDRRAGGGSRHPGGKNRLKEGGERLEYLTAMFHVKQFLGREKCRIFSVIFRYLP